MESPDYLKGGRIKQAWRDRNAEQPDEEQDEAAPAKAAPAPTKRGRP